MAKRSLESEYDELMRRPTEPAHSRLQKLAIIVGFIFLGFVIWELWGALNRFHP